jgi:hypothetical protein
VRWLKWQTATLETEFCGQRLSSPRATNEPQRRWNRLGRLTTDATSLGNTVLFCDGGNHVDLRGLLGGAEGIRTDGHRGRGEISSYSSLRQSMRAACDFRSRWGRSRTNDGALRGRVAREILMDKGDRDTALANGGRDTGLDKIWVAACRSAVGVSEPCLPFGRTMDVQVPPRTAKAIA